MNKMLAILGLVMFIMIISCAPLEEKVVDPIKVVAAQAGGSEGPSQSEFTALRLKVDRLESKLERSIGNIENVSYAKANHSHQVDSSVRSHSHNEYLLRVGFDVRSDYAASYHEHLEYLKSSGYSLGRSDYAASYHEHPEYLKSSGYSLGRSDYAEKYHEHPQYLSGTSFGGSNYADQHHTHDYAKSSHSHGGGFGGY